MAQVLIVAYLLIVLALIAVILLQRSEGGALGIGGGNAGGLMTVRGSANLLTRTTAILAALFFATAIGLTILTEIGRPSRGILDRADGIGTGAGGTTSVLDALNALQNDTGLAIPQAPAADTTPPAAEIVAPSADPALALPSSGTPAAPTDGGPTETPATGQPADSGTPAAPVN